MSQAFCSVRLKDIRAINSSMDLFVGFQKTVWAFSKTCKPFYKIFSLQNIFSWMIILTSFFYANPCLHSLISPSLDQNETISFWEALPTGRGKPESQGKMEAVYPQLLFSCLCKNAPHLSVAHCSAHVLLELAILFLITNTAPNLCTKCSENRCLVLSKLSLKFP